MHRTTEGDESSSEKDEKEDEELPDACDNELPFPGFVETVFYCLPQTNKFRFTCLRIITNPYPFLNEIRGETIGYWIAKNQGSLISRLDTAL